MDRLHRHSSPLLLRAARYQTLFNKISGVNFRCIYSICRTAIDDISSHVSVYCPRFGGGYQRQYYLYEQIFDALYIFDMAKLDEHISEYFSLGNIICYTLSLHVTLFNQDTQKVKEQECTR